jgi:hypothetical protein
MKNRINIHCRFLMLPRFHPWLSGECTLKGISGSIVNHELCGSVTRCAIVLLSFGVFFFALGIPMPSLLSALAPTDIFEEASMFEGLSLPTSIYSGHQFTAAAAFLPVFSFNPRSVDSSLFHPPIG